MQETVPSDLCCMVTLFLFFTWLICWVGNDVLFSMLSALLSLPIFSICTSVRLRLFREIDLDLSLLPWSNVSTGRFLSRDRISSCMSNSLAMSSSSFCVLIPLSFIQISTAFICSFSLTLFILYTVSAPKNSYRHDHLLASSLIPVNNLLCSSVFLNRLKNAQNTKVCGASRGIVLASA